MRDTINIVDLFAGCGGMSLGFEQVGFNIVEAIDNEESVEETYNENHECDLTVKDIQEFNINSIEQNVHGIIGGPPCQSFTNAYDSDGLDDERGGLMYEYIKFVEELNPHFFVMENVPGLLHKHKESFDEVKEYFEELGYTIHYKKLNASYYNVPQDRKRVIVVGVRVNNYNFPKPNENKMMQLDSRLKEVNSTNVYEGGFSPQFYTRNRVRSWDEPAYTVMANPRYVKIHPQAPKMVKVKKDEWKFNEQFEEEYRRYSVEECAVLQSFPEWFEFKYDDIKEGYKMVGNAVPPNLAKHIALSILKVFTE